MGNSFSQKMKIHLTLTTFAPCYLPATQNALKQKETFDVNKSYAIAK